MKHVLRVGTTEGRFRMIMPELMGMYKMAYPQAEIRGVIGNAEELRKGLERGELDIAFSGISPLAPECIEKKLLLDERLYLVISDEMLKRYLGGRNPDFSRGADLRDFEGIPFIRSLPNLHCMQILDHLLDTQGIKLECVHVSGHFDLHQHMAAQNLAACFCLSMYIPHLRRLNEGNTNPLHIFPIKGLEETNPVYLLNNKEHPLDEDGKAFCEMLERYCENRFEL